MKSGTQAVPVSVGVSPAFAVAVLVAKAPRGRGGNYSRRQSTPRVLHEIAFQDQQQTEHQDRTGKFHVPILFPELVQFNVQLRARV